MTELVMGSVQSEPWREEANFFISLTLAVARKEMRMSVYLPIGKNAIIE
jgi:hypothetical protein